LTAQPELVQGERPGVDDPPIGTGIPGL
jgi:hypothetical protein